jgi:hypothetical protein
MLHLRIFFSRQAQLCGSNNKAEHVVVISALSKFGSHATSSQWRQLPLLTKHRVLPKRNNFTSASSHFFFLVVTPQLHSPRRVFFAFTPLHIPLCIYIHLLAGFLQAVLSGTTIKMSVHLHYTLEPRSQDRLPRFPLPKFLGDLVGLSPPEPRSSSISSPLSLTHLEQEEENLPGASSHSSPSHTLETPKSPSALSTTSSLNSAAWLHLGEPPSVEPPFPPTWYAESERKEEDYDHWVVKMWANLSAEARKFDFTTDADYEGSSTSYVGAARGVRTNLLRKDGRFRGCWRHLVRLSLLWNFTDEQ